MIHFLAQTTAAGGSFAPTTLSEFLGCGAFLSAFAASLVYIYVTMKGTARQPSVDVDVTRLEAELKASQAQVADIKEDIKAIKEDLHEGAQLHGKIRETQSGIGKEVEYIAKTVSETKAHETAQAFAIQAQFKDTNSRIDALLSALGNNNGSHKK